MIKNICKDVLFLKRKADTALNSAEDIAIAKDLLETLKAHDDECVGMAANMIGINKAIIAVNIGFTNIAMLNPVITKKEGRYDTEEGCLSLTGVRPCTRYRRIEVEYDDICFIKRKAVFNEFTAQIIQHEIDHLNGIII